MTIYDVIQEENEEIQKHKWCRSQELGYDIGFERALYEWIIHHRDKWLAANEERLRAWYAAEFMPWP